MRRMLLFIFLIMLSTEEGNAQNKLTIIIDSMPAKPPIFFLQEILIPGIPGINHQSFNTKITSGFSLKIFHQAITNSK